MMHQKVVQQILLVLYLLLSYDGVQGERILSKSEDVELEKQLKLLNKPAVKTVKTKYGDVYDCIDFYQQPAFDHPLLKDHDFHPKMKPTLSRIKKNSSDSTTSWSSIIWLKDGGCPFGTVPIKRITKDDLLRRRHMPPPEDVTFDVNNNNSEPKGGYISSQGYKDQVNGNWWLLYSNDYVQVGFWPQKIFTGLTSFATNVEWGGVVYSPPGVPKPPMGSSFFPIRDNFCDAFCRSITILNKNGETVQVDKVTIHVDDLSMYKVLFERLGRDGESYLFVLYGGPGENAQV